MKVFIRDVWGDYEKITVSELQDKIDHYYGEHYIIDEITENVIYVCRIVED